MNRQDMMLDCPEEFEESLKDIIDEMEGLFNSVRDLLNIESIDMLCDIQEAHEIVSKASDDLY